MANPWSVGKYTSEMTNLQQQAGARANVVQTVVNNLQPLAAAATSWQPTDWQQTTAPSQHAHWTQPSVAAQAAAVQSQQTSLPIDYSNSQAVNQAPQSLYVFSNAKIIHEDFSSKPSIYTIQVIEPAWPDTYKFSYVGIPLRKNDHLAATCQYSPTGVLIPVRMPVVRIPNDYPSTLALFAEALAKEGGNRFMKLLDIVSKLAQGPHNICAWMDSAAEGWMDSKDFIYVQALVELPLIGPEHVTKLFKYWHKQRTHRKLLLLGLKGGKDQSGNSNELDKIDRHTLPDSKLYALCETNPYIVPEIPLAKCDMITRLLGGVPDPRQRWCGCVVRFLLKQMESNGWAATPKWMLDNNFKIENFTIDGMRKELEDYYNVVFDDKLKCVYLRFAHDIEIYLTNYIVKLRKADPMDYDTPVGVKLKTAEGVEYEMIEPVFERNNCTEDQKKAVTGALNHRISIITGGAGTGKTTMARELKRNLERIGRTHLFCSFMGKAVDCLQAKIDSHEPTTIHSVLEERKAQASGYFKPESSDTVRPSTIEHIVIDEGSTSDAELVARLIETFQPTYITVIGDIGQLEPIKWGAFMRALKLSERIPTFFLSENHRIYVDRNTKEVNSLMENVIFIAERDRQNSDFSFAPGKNFKLVASKNEKPGDDYLTLWAVINSIYNMGVKQKDMIVIVPYNRLLWTINTYIQNVYNVRDNTDGSPAIPRVTDKRQNRWCVGDSVLNKKNNKELKIYNGTPGTIVAITNKVVQVEFARAGIIDFLIEPTKPPRWSESRYAEDEDDGELTVRSLQLGSCITVDKSQGSEYDYVVYFLPDDANESPFLNLNRSYVAFSRAQKGAYCVGNVEMHLKSCGQEIKARIDNLLFRLQAELPRIPMFTLNTHRKKAVVINDEGVVEKAPVVEEEEEEEFDAYASYWGDDGD